MRPGEWKNQSTTFPEAALSTDGTVDVTMTTGGNTYERNYSAITGGPVISQSDLLRDAIFFNNRQSGNNFYEVQLDDLKAGSYEFKAYHVLTNNVNGDAQVDILLNGSDTGMDVTLLNNSPWDAPVEARSSLVPFTVANDNDPITIRYANPTQNHFGLNGFELDSVGPPPPPPPTPVKINPAELSATANTTYPNRTPNAAVDGSGLDDVDNPTTHTDAGGDYVGHWTSGDYNHGGGVEADEWLVVDLGGVRDLAEMRLWSGFNDRSQTRNPTRRNLERFDLYYANSAGDPGNPLDNPANWTLLLDDQAVPDPDTNNINVGGDNNDLISVLDAGVYDLGGTTATHLGLFDLQNGGQDGWSGRHTAIAEIEVFETVAPDGDIPEPATVAMLGLAVTGLGAYARKRRREAMKHLKKISAVLVVGSLLGITSVCGAYYMDLTGDNVDINSDSSWTNVGGGGGRRAGIGNTTTGLTGYLNTTYTDSAGRPQINEYWDIKDGHLDLQNGAVLTNGKDLKLLHPSDPAGATVTLNPGASFECTTTSNSFGMWIAYYGRGYGTFVVNNGGTLGSRTDVGVGVLLGGGEPGESGTGIFKVIGDGGTVDADNFWVYDTSEVIFELDDTGISPIDVANTLKVQYGATGAKLTVDTSAFLGQHTVDLFTYGQLVGTFGTVEVLGSELLPGNGTDPGTYDLVYGNGKVTMTYNNPAGGPEGDIPEPATMAMLGLAVTTLGAYARKRRSNAMKQLKKISALLVVGSLLGITSVCGAYYMDLTGDNVNINSDSSWYSVGGGGGRRAGIGNATTGLTGYLNTTYTDSGGRPQVAEYWDVKNGHLDLQNGANLTKSSSDLKLAHPSDETAATITLNPGAFFEQTNTNDSYGVFIGYNNTRGTFIVNNGGTVGSRTDIALGGTVGGAGGDTSTSVGVFEVIGDGGTINTGYFRVSRYSEVIFELDDTGVSTINVGQDLKMWNDGAGPGGKLTVDTSAFLGQHTVDLFTYGQLVGTFGTVEVLGSELLPGNGTDPGTYDLAYGNGKVTMTYNNPAGGPDGDIPEPATMAMLGLAVAGLGGYVRRRKRS